MKTLDLKLTSIGDGDSIVERFVKLTAASPLTIGRASRNRDIEASAANAAIDNPVVSKQHAVIRTDPDCKIVYIRDMQSMHGTKVDEYVLSKGEEVAFGSGARLQFGTTVIHGERTFVPATYKVDFKPADLALPIDQTSLPDSDLKQGYTDYTKSDYSTDSDSDEELSTAMDATSPVVSATEHSATSEAQALFTAWDNYADRWSNSEADDDSEQDSCPDGDIDDYPDEESVSGDSDIDEDEDNHSGGFPATPREASVEIAPTSAQTVTVLDLTDKDDGDHERTEAPKSLYNNQSAWDITAGSNQGHESSETSKSIFDNCYNWGDTPTINSQWIDNSAREPSAKYVSPYNATDMSSIVADEASVAAYAASAAANMKAETTPEPFKVSFGLALKDGYNRLAEEFDTMPYAPKYGYDGLPQQKPFMNAISDIVEGAPVTKNSTAPTAGSKRKASEAELEDQDQAHWAHTVSSARTPEEDESMLEAKMKERLAYAMEHDYTLDQCLKELRGMVPPAKPADMKFGLPHQMKRFKIQSKWIAKARESYFTSKDLDSADASGKHAVGKSSMAEASSTQPAIEQSATPTAKPFKTLSVQPRGNLAEVTGTSAMVTQQPPKKRTTTNFLSRARDGAVGFVIGGAVMFGALANLPESLFA
ncbi:uncharacterized protein K452DRAFT_89002 [Aplosporella prunicola CBS 121167]|uniref:FHA domain-containing protein n=1 Tax=Aplosporella prunicola CBS 121167 TaxID=1176127 RepID=A0A6A6B5A9_9PEZI|nr:uncharacterized protein K452DRAFT_89002 [Aplosporella prunicola CBS 121167]KAF2138603.1 hypothetical protein K452DRAFT_89002 [Aplosporella prunicola CBS 121167]